ncbi:D-methionine transport system substrate-binding protein [Thermosyntropha lipolytica DSM 11003]|uniref:Lipoprotein n=1 Tax=Thermosyntropha lipolytica DSM 11003 TaxID=1123382 RepID=A0A1M5QZY3_9FIRM|nr:MetQ/NlpA family ABC transporter substrate-binding protein [Thermosyntropha lipolytica]SHH19468.1 D-methionine transport system substrate-binding protein [Thermosyntropha lipolytica DSM 11003]
MGKKFFVLLLSLSLLVAGIAGCGSQDKAQKEAEKKANKLVVGATAKPHAEILEVIKPELAKEGIDLEIKEFTDYVLLNPALVEGEIDANFFQHRPYLDDFNAKNKADLREVVKVHTEPMGVYSNKYKNIDNIPEGAKIGIPNDATNGGRALMVLERAGLIKLREGAGVTATEKDIVENPRHIKIVMMDAPMLPRALEDLDVCVINSNYALEANLNPVKDSIFMEPKDSPFANILVVRPGDEKREDIQKLAKALQSPTVKKFLEEKYNGSCVPAF